MEISDRHGALDILASVVSNVQEYTPSKKNFPEHRVSCHRCGNIRKRKLLCPRQSCPHIFCGRCADKMIEEHGEDVFVDGCPVCHEFCCCSNKTVMCNRQNHCYRKCPATKGKNGNKNDAPHSEPEYHISAPALEILAQVVSDPFQRENYFASNRPEASPSEPKPKRKSSQASPTSLNMSNTASSLSLSAAMYDTRPPPKSPRLEGLDRSKMFLLPPPPETTGLLVSNPPSAPTSALFNLPFSAGLQGSFMGGHSGLFPKDVQADKSIKQANLDANILQPSLSFPSDAAAASATYAISSLSALTAAAGNYDQYTQNIKVRSSEISPSVPILSSGDGMPPSSSVPKVLNNSSAHILPILPSSTSNYEYSRPLHTDQQQSLSHLMPTKNASSFLNHPQYMVTAAALSDSSYDSYITPSIPISSLGRPVQPTTMATNSSKAEHSLASSLDS